MTPNATQARTALGVMRITIGSSALLAPRLAGRLFGFRPAENPELPAMGRMFAIRNVAMGLDLLQGDRQSHWPRYHVAIDAADAVVLLAGGARGYLSKRTTVIATATALLATALGVIALGED